MNRRMAHILFWLALTLAIVRPANGQIILGPVGGITWTTITGDVPDQASYDRRFDLAVGLECDLPLSDDIALSLQPTFVRYTTGISYDVGKKETRDSLRIKSRYAGIGLILLVQSDTKRWYLSSGIQVGFLLHASLTDAGGKTTSPASSNIFEDLDVAVVMGVGHRIPVSTYQVSIEIRYDQSLLNVATSNIDVTGTGLPSRIRRNTFSFRVGFHAPIVL